MKIKKGDLVQVITGKDKGKQGKVIVAFPARGPRPRRGCQPGQEAHQGRRRPPVVSKTGGIITTEAPVHVSNVQLVVEKDGKKVVTRVGYRFDDEGNKIRVAKRTGEDI